MKAVSRGLGTIDMDCCPYKAVVASVDGYDVGDGIGLSALYLDGCPYCSLTDRVDRDNDDGDQWAGRPRYGLMSLRGSPLGLWTMTMMSCRLGSDIMSNHHY